MPTPINRHQPTRPSIDPETGTRLLYRVHPIMKDNAASGQTGRVYRTHEPANQLAQMQLYRWCRSTDFVQAVSCRELYDYLITEPMRDTKYLSSIHHFGRTILNAVDYDPRKLKAKDKNVEKTQQIYFFHSRLDLQYGLEYMICSWLRKFLNDASAPGSSPVSGPSMMEEELDILASSSWDDYWGLYVEPLNRVDRLHIEQPDWRALKKAAANAVRVDEDGIRILDDSEYPDTVMGREPRGKLRSMLSPR